MTSPPQKKTKHWRYSFVQKGSKNLNFLLEQSSLLFCKRVSINFGNPANIN